MTTRTARSKRVGELEHEVYLRVGRAQVLQLETLLACVKWLANHTPEFQQLRVSELPKGGDIDEWIERHVPGDLKTAWKAAREALDILRRRHPGSYNAWMAKGDDI